MEIVIWPSPILKQKSEACVVPPYEVLTRQMTEVMKANNGVGLSAIQVGLAQSFFIMVDGDSVITVVNPKVLKLIGKPQVVYEGCLSLPGVYEETKRHLEVEVQYQDESMSLITRTLTGLSAQVFCHETEHCSGQMFIDKLSAAKRSLIRGNLQKAKRKGVI